MSNTVVNEQHLPSKPNVNGFQVTWGFTEPSDEGLNLTGWYTNQAHWSYSRGFNASVQDVVNQSNSSNGMPLAITNALPINDGLPDGPNGKVNGAYVPYDRFFGLDYTSSGAGGNVNWNFTPLMRGDWYKLAPTAGIQALFIGETFTFNGAASGGTVTFNTPPGLEDPTTYVQTVAPFAAQIRSDIKSYLFGPQAGIKFEIGGDNFKILGNSQFGLSMNNERILLTSRGVGDGFSPFYDRTSRFSERQNHIVLSPTTTQQVTAQARIFQYIPVVRKIHFLEQATFRLGYQINVAYNVQRPNRTIQYNGFPLIPAIRTDQATNWYTESFNFGVHWTY